MAASVDQSDRDLEEQARSMISCAVCMEEFIEPRVLPCQHTFCQACLKRCFDSASTSGGRGFACPTCRAVSHFPSSESLSQLPSDFKVQQIRDMLQILENKMTAVAGEAGNHAISERGNQCVVCRYQGVDRAAERFCVQCVKHFCSKCSVRHSKTGIFRDHLVVDTSEKGLAGKNKTGSTSSSGLDSNGRCYLHDSEYKYHCVECDASLCTVCALQREHMRHNILDLDTAAAQQTKALHALMNQLGEKIFAYGSKLELLANVRRSHSKLFRGSEKEIKKACNDAMNLIKQQEESLLKELKSSHEEKFTRMCGYEKELLLQQSVTRKSCQAIAEVLNPRTSSHEMNQRYPGLVQLSEKELADSVNPNLPKEFLDYMAFLPEISINLGNTVKRVLSTTGSEGITRSRSAITLGSVCQGQAATENQSPKPSKRWFSRSLINRKESLSFGKSKQKQGSEDGIANSPENIPATILETSSLSDVEPMRTGVRTASSAERVSNTVTQTHGINFARNTTASPDRIEPTASSTRIQTTTSLTRIVPTTEPSRIEIIARPSSSANLLSSRNIRETFNELSGTTVTDSPATRSRANDHITVNVITSNGQSRNTTTNRPTTASSTTDQILGRNIPNLPHHPPPSNARKDLILAGLGRRLSTLPRSGAAGNRRPYRWRIEEFTRCRDCCFIGDNRILSIVGLRLKIFDATQGRPVSNIIAGGQIVEPWSLCHDPSNSTVILTDRGSPGIKLLRLASDSNEGSGVVGLPTTLSCPFQQPSGIAITRGGYYVITNTGTRLGMGNGSSNRVGIYTTAPGGTLAMVREFGATGCAGDEVMTPNFVAVDHQDRIVVSDCDGFQVKVFSHTGQMLLNFSACGSDGRDMRPQGVAIDDDNNILLVDQSMGGVTMYSSDGQMIDNLVDERKGPGSGTPWGLGFDSSSKLMALGTDRGLELYQL